ncbi:hypothetical protein PTTG_29911 [Puccinia triticina 1-1 BBBD Race 1]|uniref:Uncharacterized protein n=1 Tax=Puccinia triticina (isolate 1-1 / race 1 (BBBD)) TaxID=630390 RepID=A0A180G1H5_PUCT1|nr:hypothetical protein PTTG_29911 [Puccinia triticina 1-1 BBBD Race 1]
MSPSPAPDPPPPPPVSLRETPIQTAIQITGTLIQFLNNAASSKNLTQVLNLEQICHALQSTLAIQRALEDIKPSKNNEPENQTLKIVEQLYCIEQQPIPTAIPPHSTWALVATNQQSDTKKGTQSKDPKFKSPTNKEINEFKTASLVICTPPGFSKLDLLLATKITSNINKALALIDTSTKSAPIKVAGIVVLPLKDLKIYTPSQPKA